MTMFTIFPHDIIRCKNQFFVVEYLLFAFYKARFLRTLFLYNPNASLCIHPIPYILMICNKGSFQEWINISDLNLFFVKPHNNYPYLGFYSSSKWFVLWKVLIAAVLLWLILRLSVINQFWIMGGWIQVIYRCSAISMLIFLHYASSSYHLNIFFHRTPIKSIHLDWRPSYLSSGTSSWWILFYAFFAFFISNVQ